MKKRMLKICISAITITTLFWSTITLDKAVYATNNPNAMEISTEESTKNHDDVVDDYNETSDNNSTYNFDDVYVSEENYKETMDNIVMPYIESRMKSGYIDGVDDVKLYYEVYTTENAKGNIVISHGYTESLEKNHETIYYFLKSGYNVFGIEHRGHGRSGSLGVADKSQIYVNSFNDYIEDFKTFMDQIVVPESNGQELLLFAHSMGGAIGSRLLEVYPDYFSKAVLNAPMMEVDTGNIPSFIAKIVVKAAVTFGQGGKYVVGKEPFSPCYSFKPVGTSSENRWSYVNDIVNNNVEIPVLLSQSGDDAYVKPDGQNKFAEHAQNCELVKIEAAKHEIYFERDEIQKPYFEQVLKFYNE